MHQMSISELTQDLLRLTLNEGFTEAPVPGLRLYRQNQPTVEPLPVIYSPSICVV